ncbi:helix-turn-helix transcriptional regulator [Sporosarcina sp. FSL W7-1349]|uniref:helix-turn-helix transcriptional regulator n=1 Tax=Sporosarcina sp. FSL W7-1349 TaxID=2921561 RepID=UPI0030F8CBEE
MRKWLKKYRDERKLTQDETAKLSGISRTYYTHIENGTKTPSVEVAKSIAKTLQFDWVNFFKEGCSFKEQKEVG